MISVQVAGGCETFHSDNDEELAMERKLYNLGVVLNIEDAQSPFSGCLSPNHLILS